LTYLVGGCYTRGVVSNKRGGGHMKIKRLKPGMLFISPLTDNIKAYGLLVKRIGRDWSVWVTAIEDGKVITPYLVSVPGKSIREEWIDKHNYELHE